MATATMGPSSVDRLARSKRPTVERAEIHIPPAPVFPLEAVTGDPSRRAQAVASFNNALQKWRNDAWSIEAPFVPDAELQSDVATLEDATAKMSTKLDRAAVDIRRSEANITTISSNITSIDNSITIIEGNAITGTGIVQANGANPPTAILGTPGHVPYWTSVGPPYIALTSPIYTDGTLVGIGTDLPAVLLDVGLAGVTAGVMRLAGGTSGNVTITTAATTGMWTLTLPINDGVANEFLKTDGAGVTSWSGVVLTTDVTGVLLVANGGTNASSWTAGSVIFAGAGGLLLAEDNANIFWNDTTNRFGVGTASPSAFIHVLGTTEQLRLGNTVANYTAFTTSATGNLTIAPIGGNVTFNALLTATAANSSVVAVPAGAGAGFLTLNNSNTTAGNTASIKFAGAGVVFNAIETVYKTRTAGSEDGILAFTTIGAGTKAERMRIIETGFVGIGTSAPGVLLDIGLAGTRSGTMRLAGLTSGNVTIQPAAIAGTWTFTLPIDDGTNGQVLSTDGAGTGTSWVTRASLPIVLTTDVTGILPIANGGTNASSFVGNSTDNGITYFNGTSLVSSTEFRAEVVGASARLCVNFPGAIGASAILNAQVEDGFPSVFYGYNGTVGAGSPAILISISSAAGLVEFLSTRSAATAYPMRFQVGSLDSLYLDAAANVVLGNDSTVTTRTDDFTYICTSNGPPTGVPTGFGNRVPITFDPNTDTFYIYRGGWKGVVVL